MKWKTIILCMALSLCGCVQKEKKEDPSMKAYEEVVDLYEECIEKNDWDYTQKVFSEKYNIYTDMQFWMYDDIAEKAQYCIMDINQDEHPELLIAHDGTIARILGYDYEKNNVVSLAQGWSRSRLEICKNGYIYNAGSSGNLTGSDVIYYEIQQDQPILVAKERYSLTYDHETESAKYSKEIDGKASESSEDEFKNAGKLYEKVNDIDWKPIRKKD